MYEFMGIPIVTDERLPEFTPVIELRSDLNISSEFREKTNKWYVDMFGMKRTMLLVYGRYIAHPNTVRALKKTMS